MKTLVLDILADLVVEDVMADGQLFEFNPNHDAEGKFTSKDAAVAYQTGAMAVGRAAAMKAKAKGYSRGEIRATAREAMQKHLENVNSSIVAGRAPVGRGETVAVATHDKEAMAAGRAQGQAKLDLIRTKIERGTIPGQVTAKAEKAVDLDRLKTTIDGIKAAVKAEPTAPAALPAKDQAYVQALLKPETDQWKREAKAGNIDRVLEHDAAGKIKLSDETRSALKAARAELTKGLKAAPKAAPVNAQTKQMAEFLGKWSRGKEIAKVPGFKEFYRSGKYMTKLTRDEVDALLKGGIAKGTVDRFTVPKVRKTAADREAELD